ncbi:MAG: aminotransferase class I/II-fold pyridoxal phosphate-dependent enzyme [Kordiimonadaceae bacterium]|jgi:7-keto-8-aminopelargonate synthetase-like enzyme|nr:aminotransferase class I/II-fold pyridoxal phosphate-dependent enzyme [Kordiimonadaceae bacterium]MBT6035820.1 aminotransferase class I/II-fold pyridoxal phosphate-dependent enzyme [Kordiimonadaceae bacterium]MBT6329168.1 aminotransferase class I/II-fold pyridoxal phosphate-dependent enzyme [Kordiimonadaceae bacterium]MBT7581514.1 aminotransferase class I/II-fold pyridoxal phosphate-dependent enzyme [Kordiimonadaceae bacterium]
MTFDLFEKFDSTLENFNKLPTGELNPFTVSMDEVLSPTEAMINGRKTILAGTNNYMGMTYNKECMDAAEQALKSFGTGTTGSRVLNGTYNGHKVLEETLKDFYEVDHAIVFSTGYQANLGVIATIAGPKDYVVIDADSHASIYDGCAMGNATIVRFTHNDPENLDKRLARIRRKDPEAGILVVIEGVYSMLGDQAPIKELAEASKKHNAFVLVDEAHSIGVFGKTGRGVAQEQGVEHLVDFTVGTFSKSVGTVGGYCVSNHPKFEVLRLVCRPYVFTASLPPSVVASANKALELIKDSNLRVKLLENSMRLNRGLSEAGFNMGTTGESPIAAIIIEEQDTAIAYWQNMMKEGVYVNLAVPPATPNGLNLMRCSLSAAHSTKQIDYMLEKFIAVGKDLGVLS